MQVFYFIATFSHFLIILTVKRVHFLRARALKDRWKEEVILLNYEMQWTVRFFKNKSEKWKVAADTLGISSGAKAYALRQEFRWKGMAMKSDRIFKITSVDYLTPFVK